MRGARGVGAKVQSGSDRRRGADGESKIRQRFLGSMERLEERAMLAAWVADAHTVDDFRDVYSPLDYIPSSNQGAVSYLSADRLLPFTLDRSAIENLLAEVPLESSIHSVPSPFRVSLPAPDGHLHTFAVAESPVMEPALAAQFPEIKTYVGQGVTDPTASVRFDLSPLGFHAQVLSPHGSYYIQPYYHLDQSVYVSFYRSDVRLDEEFQEFGDHLELLDEHSHEPFDPTTFFTPESTVSRRDIRVAITTTTAYNNFFGNNVTNVLSAVTTAINQFTGVFEVDMAIRFLLVANTTRLFSGLSGPGTDNPNGVLPGSSVSTYASNNQSFTDTRIGSANYDLGHVLHSGTLQGVSQGGIGIVGRPGLKAQATTSGTPTAQSFYVVTMHEMGHQFGARHNFNNCSGSQGDSSIYAIEPGSGSTIMSYAGVCNAATNLQSVGDPYYNHLNLNQMTTYINGSQPQGLPTPVVTGNNRPVINALSNFTIPDQTPFRLYATGFDPDGDTVSYTWEQANTGGAPIPLGTDPGSGPIIRSRPGVTSGLRSIPPLNNVLNNTLPMGETLPLTSRTLNFTVTARDQRAGEGGTSQASMVVTSVNSGTGFAVTAPNTASVTWVGGTSQTVTWNVSGSNAAPINTANVRIRLSVDGGTTFPYVLAMSAPNTGSHVVQVPYNLGSSQARIMIESVGNIFYDISNANFTVSNVSLANPPAGVVNVANVSSSGGTAHTINVTYTDNLGLNLSSLGDDDIVVQLPNGSVSPVTYVGIIPSRVRSVVVAQYVYTPPGGTWDAPDNGTYSILSVPGAVVDLSGDPINGGVLGTFSVSIGPGSRGINADGEDSMVNVHTSGSVLTDLGLAPPPAVLPAAAVNEGSVWSPRISRISSLFVGNVPQQRLAQVHARALQALFAEESRRVAARDELLR